MTEPREDLTFASAGVAGVHYARCWSCMLGQHYPTPTWHTWADSDDVEHARATGQPDPSTGRCGCPCVNDADFCAKYGTPEPEPPDIDEVSLDGAPCAECGAAGACAYDNEGRPLIHTTDEEEDA